MKTITNTTYEDGINTPTTASLLKEIVSAGTSQGMDIAEMRARMKVLDVLEALHDTDDSKIVFEDAVYETAKKCVRETKFIFVKPHLVKFAEQFGI